MKAEAKAVSLKGEADAEVDETFGGFKGGDDQPVLDKTKKAKKEKKSKVVKF